MSIGPYSRSACGRFLLGVTLITTASGLLLAQAKTTPNTTINSSPARKTPPKAGKPVPTKASPATPTRAWMAPTLPSAGPTLTQDLGYGVIDFFMIADFDYNPTAPYDATPPKHTGAVPAWIIALDGKKMALDGMVTPLDWDKDGTNEFILTANTDVCGYGATPRINEWAYVQTLNKAKVKIYQGNEVTVRGTFHFEEEVQNGFVVGLYSIVADSVK